MTVGTRLICALLILSACSDPATSPPPTTGPDSPSVLPRSAALVSPSIPPAAASNVVVVGGTAYVSMAPGTDPDGQRVSIRNLHGGASVTSPMSSGGFDPVAVQADAEDTLLITVLHKAGDSTRTYGLVPVRARPVVVRVSPARGRTDVPLNSLIMVVFNQPMDSASLTGALHLLHEGVDVLGSVSVESTGGVILNGRFVPDRPLNPSSTYELSVSTAAQSVGGIPLEAPVTIEFTTEGSGSPASRGLTFVREAAVFVSASDGSEPVPLLTNAARPAWSPDGSRIAFSRPAGYLLTPWQLCIAREDGSDVRCAVGERDGDVVGGPSWSPDGATVAFSVYLPCETGVCNAEDRVFSSLLLLNSLTMKVVSVGTLEVWSLSWSPDGRKIAVALYHAGAWGRGALGTVNPDGSGFDILAPSLGSYTVKEVTWSPDGSRLGLSLFDEDACPWYCDTAIGIVNSDGTHLRVLDRARTSEETYLWAPAWSPDGTRLAYTVSRGDSCWADYRIPCGSDIAAAGVGDGQVNLLMPVAGTPTWRK